MSGKREVILHVHTEIAEQVRYADAKSGVIIAGALVMIVAVADRISSILAQGNVADNRLPVALVAATLLGLSIAFALAGVYPRKGPAGSRLSWVSIAAHPEPNLMALYADAEDDVLDQELSDHTWELSVVAQAKYKWVSRSLLVVAIALVPALYTFWAIAPSSQSQAKTAITSQPQSTDSASRGLLGQRHKRGCGRSFQ